MTKKGREQLNAFLIEGVHLVEEALKSPIDLQAVIYDGEKGIPQEIRDRLPEDAPLYSASPAVIEKLSDTKTPQGIIAVVGMPSPSETEIRFLHMLDGTYYLLMLDAVQDPGNLGTIIRTADAAGVDGVILGRGTVDLYNPKTIRSTMGSLFHLPLLSADLREWILRCQASGARVIGTSLAGAIEYTEPLFTEKSVLIIGNEGQGVSAEILDITTSRVKIPIYGKAESLNAAVAAAILLYEGVRQRQRKS